MLLRLTASQLRKIADQLDAYTALESAGANHIQSGTVISVEGQDLAYTHWWEDEREHLVEFISFTPSSCKPLPYHDPKEKP